MKHVLNKTAAQIREEARLRREALERQRRELEELEQEASTEELILDAFERNYQLLTAESGNRLAPEVKEMALKQVLMYWRKMREVATAVTQTEVKLSLPNIKKNDGSTFTIEGVVDIVRDNDRTILYDIKTHDYHQVHTNKPMYQKQLNVYAHIWQTLRGEGLDETCIICTSFPEELKEAIQHDNDAMIERELERWNPLVNIPFDQGAVETTIGEFREVVEKIENGIFAPPPQEKLKLPAHGNTGPMFVTHVCRNCDARFGCDAYRSYTQKTKFRTRDDVFYALDTVDDYGSEGEQLARRNAEGVQGLNLLES